MYHMTVSSHFGSTHPSTIFPGPLLPPGNHSQTMHSYPSQSKSETPMTSILHLSPMLSQAPPLYQSQQPSVYINPYIGPHPGAIQNTMVPSHHHHHHQSHMQSHGSSQIHDLSGYPSVNHNPLALFTSSQPSRHMSVLNEHQHFSNRRQPLSVDEELWEEMTTLHLGYLETEDSPHKMEQREKLEGVIMEYLSITPHTHKFIFPQVLQVLEQSINTKGNFTAHEAACGFDALAQYAGNLISQPWRKEFREIKLHNGFWVHQVSSHLVGAESILELMGYVCVSPKDRSASSPCAGQGHKKIFQDYYILQGVLDPDLMTRLALDCLIAYCECQCLKKIYDGVNEYNLSWTQILQFRQVFIGGVDTTLRQLLYTLRQRAAPFSYALPTPDSALPSSPPPIPIRQSSSFAATNSSSAPQVSNKASTTSGSQISQSTGVNKLDRGSVSLIHDGFASNLKESIREFPDSYKNGRSSLHNGNDIVSPHSASGAVKKTSRINDVTDGGHSSCSNNVRGSLQTSSRVPIAKLIDLDSSHENLSHPSCKASHHLLPKVLPHRTNLKQSSHLQTTNQCSLPLKSEETSPSPTHLPKEAFQAVTLDEHVEASMNVVKNPVKNSSLLSRSTDKNSLESWDFVYRGLEKKGYNKDIGDRGDILHDMTRQKTSIVVNAASRNNVGNVNLNLNNQKKDMIKNRTLTINQALQQFTLNETKERSERPPSSRSSHSVGHAYAHENHKRNSLYDNVSGGFETAPQGSDDSSDRRLRKINNNMRFDNKSDSFKFSDAGGSRRSSNSCGISNRSAGKREMEIPVPVLNSSKSEEPTVNANVAEESITTDGQQWSCVTCTFLNKGDKAVCEMCGKSKDPGPDSKPLVSGGKQCPLCTLINDKELDECSACGAGLKGSSTYI